MVIGCTKKVFDFMGDRLMREEIYLPCSVGRLILL